MDRFSSSQRLPSFLCAVLVLGLAMAWITRKLGKEGPTTPPPSPDQALLQRSERLVRKLEAVAGVCSVSMKPAERLMQEGDLVWVLSVDCATNAGQHLASLIWDRGSGELVTLWHRVSEDRNEPGQPLSEAQASAQALRWLRHLQLPGTSQKALSVAPLTAAPNLWGFQMQWADRQAQVTIERRTGELVMVHLLRRPRKPAVAPTPRQTR